MFCVNIFALPEIYLQGNLAVTDGKNKVKLSSICPSTVMDIRNTKNDSKEGNWKCVLPVNSVAYMLHEILIYGLDKSFSVSSVTKYNICFGEYLFQYA